MTEEELTALERLCNAATPGEWHVHRFDSEQHRGYIHWQVQADDGTVVGGSHESDYGGKRTPRARVDAYLTAKARSAVPQLLAEIRRLQAVEAEARELVNAVLGDGQAKPVAEESKP